MIPHYIVYIEPSNIDTRSKIVTKLTRAGFQVMVATSIPQRTQLEGLQGLVFNENLKGYLLEEFKGKIAIIVWYNNEMVRNDLEGLIPYYEAQFNDEEFVFKKEDFILEEFTKATRDSPMEVHDDKKVKVSC